MQSKKSKNVRMYAGLNKAAICALLFMLALFSSCNGGDGGGNIPSDKTENKTYNVVSTNPRMPSAGVLESEFEDSPIGFGLSKIVDGNNNTKFTTSNSRFYIIWSGSVAFAVNYYSLTSAADMPEQDPKSWTLYGSTDNTTWIQIDKRANETFDTRKLKKEFEFDNTEKYKYIKLVIDANNGGSGTQIAEYSLKVVVNQNIDDLMGKAEGRSNSTKTPMGTHFEKLLVSPTTDADRAWLADATKEPDASQAGQPGLREFNVRLYPTAGNPSPADCNQHGIGDCSAIAVFASFAYIYPNFIRSIITDNGNQTYTVAMFDPAGNPVEVTVSNKFAANSNGNIEAVTGKGYVACWSTVLEKAMMKWQYVYKANYNIGGIGTEHVAPLFTGNGNSFAFYPGKLSNADLQRAVTVLLKKGQLVIGGFNAKGIHIDGYTSGDTATVDGHAYTFMHSAASSPLFVMRNPWGFHYGLESSSDGLLNIPNNTVIPPMIDLRIVEPGKAANYGTGVSTPYIPPMFSAAEKMIMHHVSPELTRTGI